MWLHDVPSWTLKYDEHTSVFGKEIDSSFLTYSVWTNPTETRTQLIHEAI